MIKSELVDIIADELDFSKPLTRSVLNSILETMSDTLKHGDSIQIRGFGSFVVKQYGAYEGQNPKTGEKIQVKPKKKPHFKISRDLLTKVNREI